MTPDGVYGAFSAPLPVHQAGEGTANRAHKRMEPFSFKPTGLWVGAEYLEETVFSLVAFVSLLPISLIAQSTSGRKEVAFRRHTAVRTGQQLKRFTIAWSRWISTRPRRILTFIVSHLFGYSAHKFAKHGLPEVVRTKGKERSALVILRKAFVTSADSFEVSGSAFLKRLVTSTTASAYLETLGPCFSLSFGEKEVLLDAPCWVSRHQTLPEKCSVTWGERPAKVPAWLITASQHRRRPWMPRLAFSQWRFLSCTLAGRSRPLQVWRPS